MFQPAAKAGFGAAHNGQAVRLHVSRAGVTGLDGVKPK